MNTETQVYHEVLSTVTNAFTSCAHFANSFDFSALEIYISPAYIVVLVREKRREAHAYDRLTIVVIFNARREPVTDDVNQIDFDLIRVDQFHNGNKDFHLVLMEVKESSLIPSIRGLPFPSSVLLLLPFPSILTYVNNLACDCFPDNRPLKGSQGKGVSLGQVDY